MTAHVLSVIVVSYLLIGALLGIVICLLRSHEFRARYAASENTEEKGFAVAAFAAAMVIYSLVLSVAWLPVALLGMFHDPEAAH